MDGNSVTVILNYNRIKSGQYSYATVTANRPGSRDSMVSKPRRSQRTNKEAKPAASKPLLKVAEVRPFLCMVFSFANWK